MDRPPDHGTERHGRPGAVLKRPAVTPRGPMAATRISDMPLAGHRQLVVDVLVRSVFNGGTNTPRRSTGPSIQCFSGPRTRDRPPDAGRRNVGSHHRRWEKTCRRDGTPSERKASLWRQFLFAHPSPCPSRSSVWPRCITCHEPPSRGRPASLAARSQPYGMAFNFPMNGM